MNQLEIDIAEFLINNKESFLSDIHQNTNDLYYLYPEPFYDIYIQNYENYCLEFLKKQIESRFSLDYLTIELIINKDYVTKVLSKEFLHPNRG